MLLRKIYLTVWSFVILSYCYIFIAYKYSLSIKSINSCFLKNSTNYPCPLCGSTRSIIHTLNGDIIQAFKFNMLGIIFIIFILLLTVWLIYDLCFKKISFYFFLKSNVKIFKNKKIVIIFFILIFVNWISLIIRNI